MYLDCSSQVEENRRKARAKVREKGALARRSGMRAYSSWVTRWEHICISPYDKCLSYLNVIVNPNPSLALESGTRTEIRGTASARDSPQIVTR